MNLKLKHISIENFKGIKQLDMDFQGRTIVSGRNATGKTTIMDSFMWLLFGKDSQGRSDFGVRPNDKDGKPIDNVVIKVATVLDVDGREIAITKTQEQNWVKKRGNEVAQLQGNVNRYEVNEIPKLEKDFRAYVDDLIGEELFKLITSPQAFVALKWKDQRALLLKLVSEVTDQDVIDANVKFADLADMLSNASVDDWTAKTKKALKELNKKQAELPARIDEASKGLLEADFTECELQKVDLEKQIHELETQETDAAKVGESMAGIQNAITKKQAAIGALKQQVNAELMAQRRELQKHIDDAETKFAAAFRDQGKIEGDIQQKSELLENNQELREALLKKHRDTQGLQVESGCSCPMCGQSLPEDQAEVKLAEFRERRLKILDGIVQDGKKAAADIIALGEELEALKERLATCKADKIEQNSLKAAAMKELEELPAEIDISGCQEYQFLLDDIRSLEEQAREMGGGTDYLNRIRQDKAALAVELDKVRMVLSGRDNNQRIQDRVVELQQEQRSVSQKIANQEKGLFLLEEFTKAKMDMLSSRINAKFKLVSFRLFEDQLNGGYKETCECMINGVPFSSLNAGHKVVAGLDIISALQDIYQVNAPIFIDNAESINDFNIPDMNGQLILLKVSEDNELKVEV